ncbi:MAG: DUF5995 family protein [Nocardioides sp.]
MHRCARWTGIVLTGALLVALAGGGSSASAATQANIAWSSYLQGWTDQYVPTSENDCVAGRDPCLKATLKELARIADDTARRCSHDAVFARAYLRMTQTYGWSRDIPGYYEDVRFANHQDAVFAKYYTDAYDAHRSGDRASVPEAWRIAFDASRDQRVSATGSLLLGMNAHINRDLPFVLAGVGLVAPDGSSRKPDYVAVEQWLYTATAPLLAEIAARFDPTADDAGDPWGLSNLAMFQMISGWREQAWRNAEALVSAPTPEARARVAASIEARATGAARTLLATQSYNPPFTSSGARDTWCAAHRDTAPPLEYDFGEANPYGY